MTYRAACGFEGALTAQGFHIDATLDSKTLNAWWGRKIERVQRLTCRNLQLQANQVQTCNCLGDSVFYLEPGIGFDEIPSAWIVGRN